MPAVTEISCTVSWTRLAVSWRRFLDKRLEQAIQETSQEREFEAIYQESLEAQFTKEVLLDVARTTGHILRHNPAIEIIKEEANFGGKEQAFIQLDNGRSVFVRGKVDRIDRLKADGAIGVVDYKSSLTQFQFPHFFNGLNSQLPTYLAALKREGEQNFFWCYVLGNDWACPISDGR